MGKHANADAVKDLGGNDVEKVDILTEAYGLIRGERLRFYGPPTENFQRIADMWSAYLKFDVSSNDVCCMMVLLKLARIRTGGNFHRDSAVDGAGYCALLEVLNGGA